MDPITAMTIFSAIASAITGIVSATRKSGSSQGGQQQQQNGVPKGGLQFPRFNPQQMQGLNQILGQGLQGLGQFGGGGNFGDIAQNARNRFQTDSLPSLAERFGALNSRNSSGYQGALSNAQNQFDQGLAAHQQGFNQQNLQSVMQMLGLGLTSPYENIYKTR
jgi:hypothetical protein